MQGYLSKLLSQGAKPVGPSAPGNETTRFSLPLQPPGPLSSPGLPPQDTRQNSRPEETQTSLPTACTEGKLESGGSSGSDETERTQPGDGFEEMKRAYPEHVPREAEGDSTILSSNTEHTGGAPEAPFDRETHAELPIAKLVPTAQLTSDDAEHGPPVPPQGSESLNTRNDAIPAPPRIEFEDLGPVAPIERRAKEQPRRYNADEASGIPSGRQLKSQLQMPAEPETTTPPPRAIGGRPPNLELEIMRDAAATPLSGRGEADVSSNPRRDNEQPQQPTPPSTSMRAVHPKSGSLVALAQHDQAAGNGQRLPLSESGPRLRINRLDIQIINQTPNHPPERRTPSHAQATTPDSQEALIRRYMDRIW